MKLAAVFVVVIISVCSYSASAFLLKSLLPVKDVLPPLPVDSLLTFDPLKLLLKTLGISVEHLVEGLRKCVNELGPEASEAVKKLLIYTVGFGAHTSSELQSKNNQFLRRGPAQDTEARSAIAKCGGDNRWLLVIKKHYQLGS
ncbi:secretoglobin family 3A member 2 [Echinops telfairi]|uniref:Secretoglobin family 3A member 2 n=1 Tax=Echinops telfairi TaxID=9371 RepID=A0ABM0ICR3_ECHTE|nr:secretoglobin family 3A member 2 [Echinops telfairi]